MKKIVYLLCVSILSTFFLSSMALAEKTFIVAADATWPPMEFLGADKEVIGYAPDYINAVAKEGDFKILIKNEPWDGIFAALASNQADIVCSSVTITEARQKEMAFSEPYCEIHQAVIVPADSNIRVLTELAGKKVGGQIGTTGLIQTIPKSKVDAEVVTYDEVGLAIEALVRGSIDAVICDDPVAKFYANKKTEYKDKIKIAFITDDIEYYGFAMRKDKPELLEKVNKGIRLVKEKGIDKALAEKWLGQ